MPIPSNLSVRSTIREYSRLVTKREIASGDAKPNNTAPNCGRPTVQDTKLDEIRAGGWDTPVLRQGEDGFLS